MSQGNPTPVLGPIEVPEKLGNNDGVPRRFEDEHPEAASAWASMYAAGRSFPLSIATHQMKDGRPHIYCHQIAEAKAEPGRNDPCPCGSNKKYKKCHGR